MRACVKMIIMFLLLVLSGSTRAETACISARPDSYGSSPEIVAEPESTSQLVSLQEVTSSGRVVGFGSFYRGEMEMAEKTTSQGTSCNHLRVRKSSDVSFFFKNVMQQLSSRVELLAQDQNRIFYTDYSYGGLSPCQYFIFSLRRIIV